MRLVRVSFRSAQQRRQPRDVGRHPAYLVILKFSPPRLSDLISTSRFPPPLPRTPSVSVVASPARTNLISTATVVAPFEHNRSSVVGSPNLARRSATRARSKKEPRIAICNSEANWIGHGGDGCAQSDGKAIRGARTSASYKPVSGICTSWHSG
jgi:hypothetical protein